MLLHKGNRFHGLHGEGVDLDLRQEARADQVADEVGEPLLLTHIITRPQDPMLNNHLLCMGRVNDDVRPSL
jgi:hypothetical protein